MYSVFDHWAYWSHMLTVISMFSPCTQWVFGPLSPVSPDAVLVSGPAGLHGGVLPGSTGAARSFLCLLVWMALGAKGNIPSGYIVS